MELSLTIFFCSLKLEFKFSLHSFFPSAVYNVYYYSLSNGCIESLEEIADIIVNFFQKKK